MRTHTGHSIFFGVVLLALGAAGVSAQSHIWSQRLGGAFYDQAHAVGVDPSGNVIATGGFTGPVDFGDGALVATPGGTDIFLAKYDASGAHVWSKSFGGSAYDYGRALALGSDGSVVLAGRFGGTVSFGGDSLVGPGGGDIFVAKFDANGSHVWSKSFGAGGDDDVWAVAVDSSGNCVMTGHFTGTVAFGGAALVASGAGRDLFVAKYNSLGVHQWSHGFGDTSFDHGRGVAFDSAGNVVVTGSFLGTVDFGGGGVASVGGSDVFVAKYDASGNHLWSHGFGGSSDEGGLGVAVDSSGNAIVTGEFRGTASLGGDAVTSTGQRDVFVAKYDSSGDHVWSHGFGGSGNDYGRAVAVDGSGNVALTGDFGAMVDFGGGALTSLGPADVFVVELDPNGTHLWSRGAGGVSTDQGYAVATDSSGNVIAMGLFRDTADFGDGPVTSLGNADIFLAKYSGVAAAGGGGLSHVWSRGFGDTTSQDIARSVAVDSSGNVFVTGSFEGTVDFGGGDLTSVGEDIFLAKFDADGGHLWSKRLGGPHFEQGHGVAVDSSGNVAVTGMFSVGPIDFGDGPVSAHIGGIDSFVAVYDAAGNHLWSKRLGGLAVEFGYGVAFDAASALLVTGSFQHIVDFGGGDLASVGDYDVFVAKYAANGTHLWSRRFGGDGRDEPSDVAVDASGNVFVTGEFEGTADFGGGALTSAGGRDIFVTGHDAAGNHLWSQRFGGSSSDRGYGIAADSSGYVLVTGTFWGTADFGGGVLASAGEHDVFVARFDANGTHLWSQRFGSAGSDLGEDVAVDSSGSVFVTGAFPDTVDFGGGDLTSAGSFDIFVVQLGAGGAHLWSQRFGGFSSETGLAVTADSAGNVVVGGHFSGTVDFGGGPLTSAGGTDVFLIKLGSGTLVVALPALSSIGAAVLVLLLGGGACLRLARAGKRVVAG